MPTLGAAHSITPAMTPAINNPFAVSGGTAGVDLKGQFDALWQTISASCNVAGILSVMGIVGAALVGFTVLKWAWATRRGAKRQGVIGPLIVGCVLCAPASLIPAALGALDVIVNGLMHVWSTSASGLS